jgi:hypothetical protein
MDRAEADRILRRIERMLDARRYEATIEILPRYNAELSRILYAFSCFEKKVIYDEEQDTYRIQVTLLKDEIEYLLSKIRFLGMRVRVTEGTYLKKRMLESATLALERYGVVSGNNEESIEHRA